MIFTYLCLFFSFLAKKSKIVSLFVLFFCLILFGFNYSNGDYDLYEFMFEEAKMGVSFLSYEAGYQLYMVIIKSFGFSFQNFMLITAMLTLSIIAFFGLRFCKVPSLFFCGFLVVYLPIEYVLLRNFIAFTVVLIGVMYYLNYNKKNVLLICILLACTFHISSIFYLLIYFAINYPSISEKQVRNYVIIGFILFYLLNAVILNRFIGDVGGRDEFYATKFSQFILYSFFQVLNYFIIKWYFRDSFDNNSKKFIVSSNLFLIFLIIVYYNYAIFIRIFLNFSIINVLFMLNGLNLLKKNGLKRFFVLIIYLIFFFYLFVDPVQEFSLIPLYNNNLILNE